MKKTTLAAATVPAAAGVAQAQNVTIYGTLDMALEHIDNIARLTGPARSACRPPASSRPSCGCWRRARPC